MTIGTQSELLQEFERTNDPRLIEALADRIGASGDERAVQALVSRLGDWPVRENPDVEDAVCGALVALGVMRSSGNQSFAFLPRHELPDGVFELVRQLGCVVPMRYLDVR
jgi:hypothetical protein